MAAFKATLALAIVATFWAVVFSYLGWWGVACMAMLAPILILLFPRRWEQLLNSRK